MTAPHLSIELFSGAGGLALGTAKAGFKHLGLYEWNRHACSSLRANQHRVALMRAWRIVEGDVRAASFKSVANDLSLLAGGAPCQPFSLGGKHRSSEDGRNMFPEVFRAAAETLPRAILLENVKGLLRVSFRPYFDYILRALSAPSLIQLKAESWLDHDRRLRRHLAIDSNAEYRVAFRLLNAADFGVPQRRERVFIVALRSDLGLEWTPPPPTHSRLSLEHAKWVSGTYWAEHGVRAPKSGAPAAAQLERLWRDAPSVQHPRWTTVRDALRGLPAPTKAHAAGFLNHTRVDGARAYPGHTGSPLDEPAKTLKAGDHGVPGGENMLRQPNGSVRYFTVREAARLQSFPDSYGFDGPWTEALRQLGNAVPVTLAHAVARSVRGALDRSVKSVRSRDLRSA